MIMVPEIRRLHSPDLLDMQSSVPEDPERFCILVQAMIGPKGAPGEESFDFSVCTPKWLDHYLADKTFVFGRHYLLVKYYDYVLIWNAIEIACRPIQGDSWSDVAERLSRYGRWEFEDYEAP